MPKKAGFIPTYSKKQRRHQKNKRKPEVKQVDPISVYERDGYTVYVLPPTPELAMIDSKDIWESGPKKRHYLIGVSGTRPGR